MRIDAINRVYDTYSTKNTSATVKTNKTGSKDQVALSTQAKDFAAIKNMLKEVPEVRQDKVDSLKEQIDNGTYNVSSQEVAQKILAQYSFRG